MDYVPYLEATKDEVTTIFAKALAGKTVSFEEEQKYKTYTLLFLGKLYFKLGLAMQYHINAHRSNNTKAIRTLGPDTGYDSTNANFIAYPLCCLLDSLEAENSLPKTILYSLNPSDYYVIASLMGSFQGGGTPGKLQFGSAWWFNDTKEGMVEQLKTLANYGDAQSIRRDVNRFTQFPVLH